MKRKVTLSIRSEVIEQFNNAIKSAGLRRDAYLNHVLPGELDGLKSLKPNSGRGEKHLKDMRRFLHDKFSKVNLTLDETVAIRLDTVCTEKRIPRDIFIEEFMQFLAEGPENKSCAAPLAKIYELRNDPRFEFYLDSDETTPYDWLSVSDDVDHPDLEKAKRLLKKALRNAPKS